MRDAISFRAHAAVTTMSTTLMTPNNHPIPAPPPGPVVPASTTAVHQAQVGSIVRGPAPSRPPYRTATVSGENKLDQTRGTCRLTANGAGRPFHQNSPSANAVTATTAATIDGVGAGNPAASQTTPTTKPLSAPVAPAAASSSSTTLTFCHPRTEGVTVSVIESPQGDQSDRSAAADASSPATRITPIVPGRAAARDGAGG